MKLPSIRLPSFKRRAKAPASDVDDPLADDDRLAAPPPPSKGRGIGRILTAAATVALAVLVIGGTGAMLGWLLVNAETTEARRLLQRPQLTVPILAEGEAPQPNSSAGGRAADGAAGPAAAERADVARPAHAPAVVDG